MRIVVNDYLGRAPQVQLSRALAARGHSVLHIYSSDAQSEKSDLRLQPGDSADLAIEGLTCGLPTAKSFLAQRLHEARFGKIVARRAMSFAPDVVIACNNPLDVQRKIQTACRRAQVPFVYWLQEFYSVRIDQMIGGRTSLFYSIIGGYYHWLEQTLLQRSNALVPIADDLLAILAENWNVYDRQCMVVPNWAPLDGVRPGSKDNAWARALGIENRRVALYAGSLSPMENPLLLSDLAQKLEGRSPDVLIVVVSEGEGAQRLSHEVSVRNIENLRILPFQPYDVYGDVLASADILLGLVDANAGVLFVPSKVTSYLCSGRPVVLAAPWQNLAAQSIRESGGGRVVAPNDPNEMCEAVLAYLNDDELRRDTGQRARTYVERSFDIKGIADRFERLFERLQVGPPRGRQLAVAAL